MKLGRLLAYGWCKVFDTLAGRFVPTTDIPYESALIIRSMNNEKTFRAVIYFISIMNREK